jgi:hypothetical protein
MDASEASEKILDMYFLATTFWHSICSRTKFARQKNLADQKPFPSALAFHFHFKIS